MEEYAVLKYDEKLGKLIFDPDVGETFHTILDAFNYAEVNDVYLDIVDPLPVPEFVKGKARAPRLFVEDTRDSGKLMYKAVDYRSKEYWMARASKNKVEFEHLVSTFLRASDNPELAIQVLASHPFCQKRSPFKRQCTAPDGEFYPTISDTLEDFDSTLRLSAGEWEFTVWLRYWTGSSEEDEVHFAGQEITVRAPKETHLEDILTRAAFKLLNEIGSGGPDSRKALDEKASVYAKNVEKFLQEQGIVLSD